MNIKTLLKVAQCIDPKASLSCALTNIIYRWKTDQWGHHHSRDFDLNDPNVLFEVINYLEETYLEIRFRKVDSIQWCELIHDSDEQKDLECKGETIKEAIENLLQEIFNEDE